mmetsp:Transcript_47711/g.137391  ORF Transcript_47711/g.137391 Transcript_47711/m.137391 type:complete len:555 (-) Transcript_47711:69-1733(-)
MAAAFSPHEIAVLAVAAVLILWNVVRLLRRFGRWCCSCRFLPQDMCRGILAWMRAGLCQDVSDDGIESYVAKYIARKVEVEVGSTMSHVTVVLAVAVMFIVWNTITGRPRFMTATQTWVTLVMLGASSSGITFGHRVRANILYAFFMAALSLFIALSFPVFESVLLGDCAAFIPRAVLGMKHYDLRGVVFWNLVYSIAAMSAYRAGAAGQDGFRSLMYVIAFGSAIVVLGSRAASAVKLEGRLEADKTMLHGERSGLMELMEFVCDVVVNLDDQLKLTDAASRLSAMVNFRGEASLMGMRLQDFMPDEADKTGFEECVLAKSETHGGAGGSKPRMVHARLRDGLGNVIKVELFCATIRTLLGTSYVVGIREFSDAMAELVECPPVQRRQSARQPPSGSQPRLTRPRRGRKKTNDGSSGQDAPSESDSASSVSAKSDTSVVTIRLSPTTTTGIDFALISVAAKLQVDRVAPADCCPFHLRLGLLDEAIERLRAIECSPHFAPEERLQCQSCGFLNRDGRSGLRGRPRSQRDRICFACEESLDAANSAPASRKLAL